MFCKKCGNSLKDGALFCKKCGCKVGQSEGSVALFCEECGNKLREGALFCKKCGHSVAEETKLAPVAEETKPEPVAVETPKPAAEEIKSEPVAVEPPKPMAEEIKPAPVAVEPPKPEFEKPEEPVKINTSVCQHCGNVLENGAQFCVKCGYKIERLCPNCGESLGRNLLFCGKCGAKVEKDSVAVQSAPQSAFRWHDEEEQKYGAPAPAAPQKQTKWQQAPTWRKVGTIVSFSLLAGILVYVFFGIVLRRSDEPYAPSDNSSTTTNGYTANVWDLGTSSSSSSTNGYTANVWDLGTSSDNAGGQTDHSHSEPVSQKTFTSPKTGTTFTIPEQGYAEIVHKGSRKTVGAVYRSHTPGVYTWDTEFGARLDEGSDKEISFLLTSNGSWKTGNKLGFSDLVVNGSKSVDIHIGVTIAYQGKNMNTLVASIYPKYFNDAAFQIIEADSSGKNVKYWFYAQYKVSGSGEFYTIEGVGNAVRDAAPGGGGSSGSSGGSSGGVGLIPSGKTKCIVCNGGGLVNCGSCTDGYNICPNCKGNGTYYDYAQGRIVNCNRVGCRAGKIQCSKCNGTGKKKCGTCGGDGYR